MPARPREPLIVNQRVDVECRLAEQLTDVLDDVDVVYQTRVQKERFTDPLEYEEARKAIRIDGAI